VKRRTLQDSTVFVMACVGEGPDMERRRDESVFGVKNVGK